MKLNRILYVKTRYVALETAKERRKASKNVNSTCVIISYFDYERYIIVFATLAIHIAIYVGSCSIIFELHQKLINYWYHINILIGILQSVLANEVNFLNGFRKSNAMLLLEAILLARCTQ